MPDKILAAARGEDLPSDDDDDDDDDDEPEKIRPTKRRPRYKEVSTEEEDEEEDCNGRSEEEDEEGDGESIKHYKESEMGQKGEPFTEADLYMAAKHAAQYSDWIEMSSKDRWEPFAEKVSVFNSPDLLLFCFISRTVYAAII